MKAWVIAINTCGEAGGMKVWVIAKTVWRGGWNESVGAS